MSEFNFHKVEENIFEEGKEVITRLSSYTESQIGDENFEPFILKVTDTNSNLVAGIRGYTQMGWLFISHLWVSEDHRGKGLGRELVTRSEELALGKSCSKSHVESFTFQAVDFYTKLGYEEFGRLEDYPQGHTRVYFKKDLRS